VTTGCGAGIGDGGATVTKVKGTTAESIEPATAWPGGNWVDLVPPKVCSRRIACNKSS